VRIARRGNNPEILNRRRRHRRRCRRFFGGQNDYGQTPMHYAAANGQASRTLYFLLACLTKHLETSGGWRQPGRIRHKSREPLYI
jgi:hypothetical protein